MKRPKIAMIVHYQYCGGSCIAAIITQVNEDNSVEVDLFYPPGSYKVSESSRSRVIQTETVSKEESPTWHSASNCFN